jgi:hypothetical protein
MSKGGRDSDRESYVQVYLYKGRKVVLRAPPGTEPTEAQRKSRAMFSETAKGARGRRMTTALPPAAELVRERMKGWRTGISSRPAPRWVRILVDHLSRLGLSEREVLDVVEALLSEE